MHAFNEDKGLSISFTYHLNILFHSKFVRTCSSFLMFHPPFLKNDIKVYIRLSQPSSISSFSSSSSGEVGGLDSGGAVAATFGFFVGLGTLGFLVAFGALGFLVGLGGLGFLVGFGAFCFFALASFSAAFFALAEG